MRRGWSIALLAFVAGAVCAGLAVWWIVARGAAPVGAEPAQAPARYHCPMHPEYVSDRPGDCPICGMRLVPIEAAPTHEHASKPAAATDAAPTVAGYATVNIPTHKQQSIGVRVATLERRPLDPLIRTVGRVDYDESRLSIVTTRVAGWVEVLAVDRTGQFVHRGDPLLEIYSPELVSTQEEYRLAREHLARLEAAGALPEARRQARDLLQDVRRRLQLWEIPERELHSLDEDGEIARRVRLDAPVTGHVIDKHVVQGQYVAAGEALLRIADLSRVWLLAEVYEADVGRLGPGVPAEIRLSYVPGKTWSGRVDYVYPYLEPATRTVRVRLVVSNPDLVLRPEMYADVRFRPAAAGAVVALPNEAILDTGERKIVFVSLGNGTFEPREVVTGARTREFAEVLSGLAEGEQVVVSGNFLIDSESRLQAALAGMAPSAAGHEHQH